MNKLIKLNSLVKRGRRTYIFVFATSMIATLLAASFAHLLVAVEAADLGDSVIVQLKGDPGAVWRAKELKAGRSVNDEQLQTYRESLKAAQDIFLASLSERGIRYELDGVDVPSLDGSAARRVDFRFNLVLNGVTLKVPASAVSILRSLPEVKSVHRSRDLKLQLEKSVDYVRAPQVYGQFKELTPFDTFREGFEGQGMNVAVLDTGIDWTHPMFGGDPTPPRFGLAPPTAAVNSNQKINYYMSFTAGMMDDYGHGSAAASNIAGYLAVAPGADKLPGTADDVRVHGVAPQARLMGYKVCLAVGLCPEPGTIMAIEDAVSPVTLTLQPKPIAHVINLSLGGAGGPDDPSSVAGDNAALMGTIVVASAGNDGPVQDTIGAPSSGNHVISVGANTDPAGGSNTVDVVTGERRGMVANSLEGAAAVTQDIVNNYVFCGFAETPDQVPDSVRGRIALIARGGSFNADAPVAGGVGTGLFSNKAAFAFAKGAAAVLIYNNVDGELSAATVRASAIPVLGISQENGLFLKSLIGSEAVGAVSAKQVRINRNKVFSPSMADFSSRGPVAGLGQIKPDVTAPGVGVLSATVRVGSADANTGTMFDPTGYVAASGTSFSGPHVSGAAAIVKQAHLDWSPDMVRTALINSATNLRNADGTPKPDGHQADSIIAQGGGLIDVHGAVTLKALMGVAGDGIEKPGILGSHSFGEAPVLNNRIANTREVTVTIRDVSGSGGTYDLSTANNRHFDRPGVTAAVSPSSVTVPAGGSATFTASVTLDGSQVRDTSNPLELQWYVMAKRQGGGSMRMPLYWKVDPSLPGDGDGASASETFTGTITAGDAGAQQGQDILVADGVTYRDVQVQVDASTVKLDGLLEFGDLAGESDLDLYLLDPDGALVGSSTIAGGPERINVPVAKAGTYTYRVYGWLAANTAYTLTSTQIMGGAPPSVAPVAANFIEQSSGNRYDFDGNYSLSWQPRGTVEHYEIEESTDGTNWNVVSTVAGTVTSVSFANVPEGSRNYRVRSIVPGRIGKFVTGPSNVESIIVSRRSEVDATASIEALNKSVTFPAGSTELVTALKNSSTGAFFPNVRFEIISISSTGNSVRAVNADNGGDGIATPAVFDYSQLVGSEFSGGEESGTRLLKFSNPNTVLFSFTARVMANVAVSSSSTSGNTGTTSTQTEGSATGSTGSTGVTNSSGTKLLKITVNPLTRLTTVRLL